MHHEGHGVKDEVIADTASSNSLTVMSTNVEAKETKLVSSYKLTDTIVRFYTHSFVLFIV